MLGTFPQVLAFICILAVSLAGALHASGWVAVVGAALLALVSLAHSWGRRPTRVHILAPQNVSDPIRLAASSLNAMAASGASFMLGRGAAWVWGF